MRSITGLKHPLTLALLSILPASVLGGDVLSSSGFSTCVDNPNIQVQKLNVTYDRSTRVVTFDVAGSSAVQQNVTVNLVISAYGQQVYQKSYNPCDSGTEVDFQGNMTSICPIPAGTFASTGQQTIPEKYASQIPSIAFNIPDLDGAVQLELKSSDGTDVACIESEINNGHTFQIPAISYGAAGVAAAAFALSGVTALASGGSPGTTTASPNFGDVVGWFQGMALNGMLSVQYPKVYQSFSTNFGFSTGLVPWGAMQTTIDRFRASTGGNLTNDSYQYLRNNASLLYDDGKTNSTIGRRALDAVLLYLRDGTTINVNGTSATVGGDGASNSTGNSTQSKDQHLVSGIEAYVEQLSIPQANTFMTVLLIWAIVVAALIAGVLLVKVILEAWSIWGSLPKYLESWRKRYWWRLAKAVTNLVFMLYGVWTMYCIYQFTNGDGSWAAKVLAAVSWSLFTALLLGFTFKIWYKAHQFKKLEGDAGKLYEDKETWIKYSLFYDNYKRGYYWLFIPVIVYLFARACIIAGANGHGLVQASGQLVVEGLMLTLLIWTRPYERRSSQWIGITIQAVRVVSVACILIFVEELGISQTTKTITGVVLIVVQCVMTGLLAILIAVNALIACIKENPHARKRREAKRMSRDLDNLTSLEARNSLLMDSMVQKGQGDTSYKAPLVAAAPLGDARGRYDPVLARGGSPEYKASNFSRPGRFERDDERLVSSAASMGRRDDSVSHSPSRVSDRQPRLPALDFGRAT